MCFGIATITSDVDPGTIYSNFSRIHLQRDVHSDVTFVKYNHLYKRVVISPIFFLKMTCLEIVIDFPGGSQVDAHFGDFAVTTDQPI